jgi:hypothetical protein
MNKWLLLSLTVVGFAVLPTSAQAIPISGDLKIAGAVNVSTTTIDWLDIIPGGNEFSVLFEPDPIGGDYFTFLQGTVGDAIDLSFAANPPGPLGFPGGPVNGFLTFDGDAGLSFDLYRIDFCDPAFCFPGSTTFNAIQTTNAAGGFDTLIQVAMGGIVRDTTPNAADAGGPANWSGSWTATFQGQSLAAVLADLLDGGVDAGYDAEILVSIVPQEVPEPATMLTFGVGTALLAAHRRRRAKQNK